MNFLEMFSYFFMLSIAVERGVDLIKNSVPFLAEKSSNRIRKALLLVLPVLVGVAVSYMLEGQIMVKAGMAAMKWQHHAIIGTLLGGGSGFWYNALSYVKAVKTQAEDATKGL